jgi:hypothetical protein
MVYAPVVGRVAALCPTHFEGSHSILTVEGRRLALSPRRAPHAS